jgi:WD40 repeat protein
MSSNNIAASNQEQKENFTKADKENFNSELNEISVNQSVTNNDLPTDLKKEKEERPISQKSKASKDLTFSEIYKTSSLLKSSTSDFTKNTESMQSSQANPPGKFEAIAQKKEEEETHTASHMEGLSMDWCLGLNTSCLNNVQNLTTETETRIFYTSGNTGILYDYSQKSQVLLQGHTDSISSVCFNQKQNIMVTADSGECCLMVVWDAHRGIPLKTFFEPHTNGVAVVDISPCGK